MDQEAEIGQPLLQLGLIGYFGFELKREALSGYAYVPATPGEDMKRLPDSQHMFASSVLRLDNYTGEWKLFSLIRRGDEDPIGHYIDAVSPVGLTDHEFESLVGRIRDVFASPPSEPSTAPASLPSFVALDDEPSYSQKIRAAQDAIREGEAYELTLTTKFKAVCPDVDPFAMYLSLRERNPAPYSAYINFPVNDTTILSSSPERFISIDADGVAEMKPIKGTLAVSPEKEEDERRKHQLATDVKELAENLMVLNHHFIVCLCAGLLIEARLSISFGPISITFVPRNRSKSQNYFMSRVMRRYTRYLRSPSHQSMVHQG